MIRYDSLVKPKKNVLEDTSGIINCSQRNWPYLRWSCKCGGELLQFKTSPALVHAVVPEKGRSDAGTSKFATVI